MYIFTTSDFQVQDDTGETTVHRSRLDRHTPSFAERLAASTALGVAVLVGGLLFALLTVVLAPLAIIAPWLAGRRPGARGASGIDAADSPVDRTD